MDDSEKLRNSYIKKSSILHKVKWFFCDMIDKTFKKRPEVLNNRSLDKCEKPNRVKVIKSKNGNQYLKITVHPWDKEDEYWTERAEIQAKKKLEYDKEYVQKFSFKIPEDFVLDGNRVVIWQWKRSPEITDDDAPLLSQRIKKKEDGKFYLVFTDGNRNEIWEMIPIETVIWKRVDMTYEIKFSDKWESYVVIKARCNWNDIEIYNWPLVHPKEESSEPIKSYFKFWIYRDIKENNQKASIFFKNYKIKESEKELFHQTIQKD